MIDELSRALAVTPRGSQTLSKRPAAIPFEGSHFAVSGQGYTITASDGREYVDFIGGLGALALGYNHPQIVKAVLAQVRKGSLFSLPGSIEIDVAERLASRLCVEQIRFVKTGSEACSAAVSVARAATGRDMILMASNGYHGWHDQFRGTAPVSPGVPATTQLSIDTFTYNDLASLEQAFSQNLPVAAVILEPARLSRPEPGFLTGLIQLAANRGALVIFDEMILGGRHALAGGKEMFGVTPDLSVYGKAFGAGYPLGFVAGPRHLMEYAWPVSGTFSGDCVALAACDAMLSVYKHEPIIDRMWRNGEIMMDEIRSVGNGVKLMGYAPHFSIVPTEHDRRTFMSVFTQDCVSQGLLFHPAIVNMTGIMPESVARQSSQIVGNILKRLVYLSPEELTASLRVAPYEDSVRR